VVWRGVACSEVSMAKGTVVAQPNPRRELACIRNVLGLGLLCVRTAGVLSHGEQHRRPLVRVPSANFISHFTLFFGAFLEKKISLVGASSERAAVCQPSCQTATRTRCCHRACRNVPHAVLPMLYKALVVHTVVHLLGW
jgi:hypothetical protein